MAQIPPATARFTAVLPGSADHQQGGNQRVLQDSQGRVGIAAALGITKRATWRRLADVRGDFSHADAVDAFTVFNISGNRYRLVSVIKYRWQIVYIRHILTHAEYDRGKWKL